MGLVSIEEFNAYSGNFEDKTEALQTKGLFLSSSEEIVSAYLGYDIDEGESLGFWSGDVPSVVKLSILRIATLMLTEGNGNIGLTGKSFADNSRTFINYSNYRKYLQPLDHLRRLRF